MSDHELSGKKKSATPTPKVQGGTFAGAVATVLVWIVSTAGVNMPEYVASAIGALAVAAVAWLMPDRKS